MTAITQRGVKIGVLMMCLLLDDTYKEFLEYKRLAGLSNKSLICYRDFLRPFLKFCGNLELKNLTYSLVMEYLSTLYEKNLSRSTIVTYVVHLKVFLRWIELFYHMDLQTGFICVPKNNKKIVHIYSDIEILEIYKNITNSVPWIAVRNKLIVSLMLDSGLRQGEVCSLKRSNVDLIERKIKVFGKGSKERFVPIGNFSVSLFNSYYSLCPYDETFVFCCKDGTQLTNNSVKLLISKISKKLPFEFSSHKLRHNFGTNYCLDQYDKYGQIDIYKLMVIMGHEDIKTTRKYLHIANSIIVARSNISHLDKILLDII